MLNNNLETFLISNDPLLAREAELAGVDTIFVDLEIIGKELRQSNLNTVISRHSLDDVKLIRNAVSIASVLVRVNPINANSKKEIDDCILHGVDSIMLPYFKEVWEVEAFIKIVDSRVKTVLLLETKDAVENVESIVGLPGIDYVHIGLNDLRISYGYTNMFDAYFNGVLDKLSGVFNLNGIPFGIGGIARIGADFSPAPVDVISEHARLGSSGVILSRSFVSGAGRKDTDSLKSALACLRKAFVEATALSPEMLYGRHLRLSKEYGEVPNYDL